MVCEEIFFVVFLLTLTMLAGVFLINHNQVVVMNDNEKEQLISDLPFEY